MLFLLWRMNDGLAREKRGEGVSGWTFKEGKGIFPFLPRYNRLVSERLFIFMENTSKQERTARRGFQRRMGMEERLAILKTPLNGEYLIRTGGSGSQKWSPLENTGCMECSHVFDRKQSPWRTEVWFVPLSGFKPSAFRPTAKRFPGLRTDAWTDSRKRRMKIPAMLL